VRQASGRAIALIVGCNDDAAAHKVGADVIRKIAVSSAGQHLQRCQLFGESLGGGALVVTADGGMAVDVYTLDAIFLLPLPRCPGYECRREHSRLPRTAD